MPQLEVYSLLPLVSSYPHLERPSVLHPKPAGQLLAAPAGCPQVRLLGQMHRMPLGKACWLQFQGPFWEPVGASWTTKHPGVLILPRFGFLYPCLVGKEDLGCSGVWFGLGWVYFPDLCGVPSPWHSSDLFYILWVQLGWDLSAGLPVPPALRPQSVLLKVTARTSLSPRRSCHKPKAQPGKEKLYSL